MKFCNQCGAKLDDEMMFCMFCGAKQPSIEAPVAEAVEETEAAVTETVGVAENAIAESVAEVETVAAETVGEAETVATETVAEVEAAATETVAEIENAATETVAEVEAAATETVSEAETAVAENVAGMEAVATEAPIGYIEPDTILVPKEKKSKKGLVIGIVSAVVALALIAAGIFVFFMLRKETIDAKDLVKVIGYGPDGHGQVAVVIAEKDTMNDLLNLDDAENPYMGLWSYLYNLTDEDEETYPEGLRTWIKMNESTYFSDEEAWKKVKNSDKIDEACDELLKLKVSVDKDDVDKDGTWSVGDKIKIVVEGDEDDLKKAHVVLTNTTFEYTFQEGDFAECKKINPFEGTKLVCTGREGNPTITFDESGIPADRQHMFYFSREYTLDTIVNGTKIKYTAEPYGDLSKGYLKWNNHYYTIDEKDLVKEFTVEGLEAPELLDPFEDFAVYYRGIAPELRVNLDFENECYYYGHYEIVDEKTYYNIGDTIEYEFVVNNEESLLSKGYKVDPDKTKYSFVIPATAPHIVNANDDFSKYDPISLIDVDSEAEKCIGTQNIPGGIGIGKTVEAIEKAVYGEAKIVFGTDEDGNETNVLWQFIEVPVVANGKTESYYYICNTKNVYVDEEGNITANAYIHADVYGSDAEEQAKADFDAIAAGEGETCKGIR